MPQKLTIKLTTYVAKVAHITARHLQNSIRKVVRVASIEAKLNRPSCSVLRLNKPKQKITNMPSKIQTVRLRYNIYQSTHFRFSVARRVVSTFALRAKMTKPSRNLCTSMTCTWSNACVTLSLERQLCFVCTYRMTVFESSASLRWVSRHPMSCANSWHTTELQPTSHSMNCLQGMLFSL